MKFEECTTCHNRKIVYVCGHALFGRYDCVSPSRCRRINNAKDDKSFNTDAEHPPACYNPMIIHCPHKDICRFIPLSDQCYIDDDYDYNEPCEFFEDMKLEFVTYFLKKSGNNNLPKELIDGGFFVDEFSDVKIISIDGWMVIGNCSINCHKKDSDSFNTEFELNMDSGEIKFSNVKVEATLTRIK